MIGVIYISAFAIFLEPILRAFGASDTTLPYAFDFMAWLLPGMMFTNLAFSFNNIMRASGHPVRAMFTMIIGALLNIAIAPIFIFALGLGIKGAAIATDISMLCSAIFVFAHFMRKDATVRFTRGIYRPDLRIIAAIISIGAAPSLVNAAACCINILINRSLVEYGSDLAVGAAGIFTTYASLLTTIVLGITMGMQPIVGYNYGAGHYHRLRHTLWLATAIATAITTAGCLGGMLMPVTIAKIFTVDPGLIAVTSHGLRLAMPMFWMVGFQIISTTFFQSIGKAWKSIILSMARQVIFLIPLLMILPRHMALDGVWTSFPVSDFLATVVTATLIGWQLRHLTPPHPIEK